MHSHILVNIQKILAIWFVVERENIKIHSKNSLKHLENISDIFSFISEFLAITCTHGLSLRIWNFDVRGLLKLRLVSHIGPWGQDVEAEMTDTTNAKSHCLKGPQFHALEIASKQAEKLIKMELALRCFSISFKGADVCMIKTLATCSAASFLSV